MKELYDNLIQMQDYAVRSADKADDLGMADLASLINRFILDAGRYIGEIAPEGVVRERPE